MSYGGATAASKTAIRKIRACNKLRFHVSREKKAILESHGWYGNLLGGYAHPHAMDHLTRREIARMTPEQLEHAVTHGSMSALPFLE